MPLPGFEDFWALPSVQEQRGGNSSLSFLYSEFPEEPLRLCSSSGSNLQGGNRSPFWEGFLAVLASPALKGLTSSCGENKVDGSLGSPVG